MKNSNQEDVDAILEEMSLYLKEEIGEDKKVHNDIKVVRVFGTLDLLTITFLILKLTDVIDWSWWWVFAPFWIPLALGLVLTIISFIVLAIVEFVAWWDFR